MSSRRLQAALLVTSLALALPAGCVRRTMTVNTDPQGATVTLNDQQLGTSPVKVDFTWYGTYDVVIRKEGYETLTTTWRIETPWYQLPPIDFIFEALIPFEIHDRQETTFALQAAAPVDREQLLRDAAAFRERTLYENEVGARTSPPATQAEP
jgi:hypothetical protein